MVRVRLALLAVLLSAGLPGVGSGATIILVRHADRASGMAPDALLSPAGEERARQLAEVLKDANVQRIFVTEVRRTQQTAEPIAARLRLKPIIIAKEDLDTLVSQLRKAGDDETVLVVGHADTVPEIIERLGGGAAPQFRDNEYDRLTLLFTRAGGKVQAVMLRYGKLGP